MPDPVAHFHAKELVDTFNAFSGGMGDYYTLYCEDIQRHCSAHEGQQVLNAFFSVVNQYQPQIARAIPSQINEYTTYYNVSPINGVDEFKLIYFTGIVLASFLERESLVKEDAEKSAYTLASQATLYGAIFMLDHRLKTVTNGAGRPALRKRLAKIVKDRNLKERLGAEGLYLIYKIAYNVLKENTNS